MEAWSFRGLVFLNERRFDPARQAFERALALDPVQFEARLGLGTLANLASNWREAILHLERALAVRPRCYAALFERCRAFYESNELAPAEQDCRAALDLGAGPQPELRLLLGNIYLRTQRLCEALEQFEAFLQLAPASAAAPHVQTVIQNLRGSLSQARR